MGVQIKVMEKNKAIKHTGYLELSIGEENLKRYRVFKMKYWRIKFEKDIGYSK